MLRPLASFRRSLPTRSLMRLLAGGSALAWLAVTAAADVSSAPGEPDKVIVAQPVAEAPQQVPGAPAGQVAADGQSADNVWQFLAARPAADAARSVNGQYAVVSFSKSAFDAQLTVVARDTDPAAAGVLFTMPFPDGTFEQFIVKDSPMIAPELQAAFPEIRTFSAQGVDDPTATARFGWTAGGFHAIVLSASRGTVFVDTWAPGDTTTHIVYRKGDLQKPEGETWRCYVEGEHSEVYHRDAASFPFSNGGTLRAYVLAVAATGEYTAAAPAAGEHAAGTKGAALARMVATINRVSGIYERELAVRLTLKTGTTADATRLIYDNASTDPYSNAATTTELNTNQTNLDTVLIGEPYDVGHLFQTSDGGVAQLRSPCAATQTIDGVPGASGRARGLTGSSEPTGDAFDVDYVAHEIGHQFGGNHTFNSAASGSSCAGGNRNAGTAYEVGSGSTIQAYAGICSPENLQSNSNDYFHVKSLDEMTAFITNTSTGDSCGTDTNTNNTLPTVEAGNNFTIPARTPFMLNAQGADASTSPTDALTYTWEQFDLGGSSTSVATATTDDGSRPLFRSYRPSTSPRRFFPSQPYILNNATPNVPPSTYTGTAFSGGPVCATGATCLTGETLPTTARTMRFMVTVRDNRSGGGGIVTDEMTVTTVDSTGFKITSHNSATTLTAGTAFTLTWDVAGTGSGTTVNAANVQVLLSTDGGLNFTTTLLNSTPNDGTESVTIPTSVANGNQIRLLVQPVGNIFFDVNDANLTLTGGGQGGGTNSAPATPEKPTGTAGNNQVNLTWTAPNNNGSNITRYEVQHATSADGTYTNTQGCSAVTGNPAPTSCTATGLTNGTAYFFKVRAQNTHGFSAFSPASDPITPNAPCSYQISPESQSVDRLVSNETVTVTASSPSCAWTATVATGSTSMLSISSGASGTGGGTVAYQVSQNPGTTSRTGTMTIAGQTFTVTQSADSYTVDITVQTGSTPVAGAFVALIGSDAARPGFEGVSADPATAFAGTRRKFGAVTTSSGVARFRGVVPGTFTIKAHSGGRFVTSGSITVSPTSLSSTLSFTSSTSSLTTLGAYGSQTGTIVADGQSGVFYLNTTAIPSLFRTTDYGGNWSPVTLSSDDPTSGLDASTTASAPTTSGYGGEIATIVGNKVWYSFDFGLTWASMTQPTGVGNAQMFWAHINDGVSTVSQLFLTGTTTTSVYVADMTASTPSMSAMASSYKSNAGDLVAVGNGNSAPVIAVFNVSTGATQFWAVDATPASTDSSVVVSGLAPTLATNGTTALSASHVTLFKIGGPATGVSIGSVSAPNTVLVYSLESSGPANARLSTCTASSCSFPTATTFKNSDDSTSTTSTFANTGGTSESVSLCSANVGAVGSVSPLGGVGTVASCLLTTNSTTLEVRAIQNINNNTGLAFDAAYDGTSNFVIISGDGQHGAIKSARNTTGAEASSGLNRPYFPGYPSIAAAGSGATSGGIAVQGITSAVIRQTLFQPASATNMASLMSFSGGGRTIGSVDGGTTWFTLADRGGARMDWWNGASGAQWIVMGTTGAGQWMWGTKLAAASDFAESTTMPTVKNGSSQDVGPTDFSMTGTVVQTPGVWGVKGISGTDFVALGSYDGAKLRIDLSRLSYTSPSVTLGTLFNLIEAIPDPPMSSMMASDVIGGPTANAATGTHAGQFRMAYCPTSGSHASVADALFVATGATNQGGTSELRKFVGIGAGAAQTTPSFTSVVASSLTVPTGSNLRDIAVNCTDGTVWLARSGDQGSPGGGGPTTPTAGVLKSTDGGATFAAITLPTSGSAQTALQNVVALDFNKTTTAQIVAVSRHGDVVVSDDSGTTWRMVNDTSQAACTGQTTQCGRGFGGEEPGGFAMPPATTGSSLMAGDSIGGSSSNAVGTNSGLLGSGAGLHQVSLAAPGTVTVTPSTLSFAATKNGSGGELTSVTLGQTVTVSFSSGAPSWTVTTSQPWISLSQSGGTGAGTFVASIVNPSNVLGASTSLQATITLTASGVSNSPRTLTVNLTIDQSNGSTVTGPIGQVDTPAQDATGVQGAIGVTGWVLDNIGVTGVKIYRNCLVFENQANCQTILGQSMVFIGDAAFLAGARPDVETAFSSYPASNRAGWGYLLLTSMLPQVVTQQSNGGVGPLTLFAVATDAEGNLKILGRSSDPNSADFTTPTRITMANDTIAKPFGAIDTPAQGATVSATFPNFGWVLTPDSNTTGGEGGDILVPTTGSTAVVYIDSVGVATVTYNQCRGNVGNPVPPTAFCNDDVANIFGNPTPQPTFTERTTNPTLFRNLDAGRGAIGSYDVNTSTMTNGLHTIAWGVRDSANREEGIGSRFFNVLNSGSDVALRGAPAEVRGLVSMLAEHGPGTEGVWGRAGYGEDLAWTPMHADATGRYRARLNEQGRLQLWLGAAVEAGYLVAPDGTLRDLPVGSRLDGALFGWMPPVGYVGTYHLAFLRGGERIDVDVTVWSAPPVVEGEAQIRMHLDEVRSAECGVRGAGCEAAHAALRTGHSVLIQGWAFDPQGAVEAGIGAVHVWARKMSSEVIFASVASKMTSELIFLGEATLDVARPDVARAFDGAPSHAGFQLDARLAPGTYEITAYVWNVRTWRWEDARTVTITVK